MTFDEMIEDVKKLRGMELQSIVPGSNLYITNVSDADKRIYITTSKGKAGSRPYSELKRIWVQMQEKPVVHVDEVLHGSGSSRNQPETILANLPYVEWLRVSGKKHIALVEYNSHPYGTLKRMDPIRSATLLKRGDGAPEGLLVVVEELVSATNLFSSLIGIPAVAVQQGIYRFERTAGDIYIADRLVAPLDCGSYILMKVSCPEETKTVELLGHSFKLLDACGVSILSQE